MSGQLRDALRDSGGRARGASGFDNDDSIEHLAELHRQHDRATTPIQYIANWVTGMLGRPTSLAIIFGLMIAWMAGNYLARRMGITVLEEFPFPDLAFVATLAAVVIALLILTTQRHQDQLAERRAQLTLQIATLSEKKIAKVIALLEEQRRENPMLVSRVDDEAEAMARSPNPAEHLESLDRATWHATATECGMERAPSPLAVASIGQRPGDTIMPAKTATLYRMILPDHTCPFGVRAKQILQDAAFEVDDRILRTREEVDAFEEEQGVDTTPQVFIDEERIGGSDDLERYLEQAEGA